MVANIWVAASDNQITVVEDYINSGKYTPDSKDPNGYTPIHAAASYGHIDLLKLLISKGGDINIQDNDGDTPLHHCEDLNTATFIINDLKADWKITNQDGQTALDVKEEEADEFPDLVKYLQDIKYGVDGQRPEPAQQAESQSLIDTLPLPGNVEGKDIRYTMENEPEEELDEERRKQIEAIINGENPEEALRDLVRNAVHEGMVNFQQEQEQEPNSKKRKD